MSLAAANLHAILQSSPDIIYSVDLEYRLIVFNAEYSRRMFENYGIHLAVGMRAEDFLPQERAAYWLELYARGLAEGPLRTEYNSFSGRILEVAVYPILRDGKRLGVSVFGQDVTSIRAGQAARLRAERRYREIFDQAPEAIYRRTRDRRFLVVNRAFAELFGFSEPEEACKALNLNQLAVFCQVEDRDELQAILEKSDRIQGFECQLKRKDGSTFWGAVSAWRVEDSEYGDHCFQGIVQDIDERKRTQRALRDSEDMFARFFEASPALISIFDIEDSYRILDVNPAWERWTGYTRGEVVGRTPAEVGMFQELVRGGFFHGSGGDQESAKEAEVPYRAKDVGRERQ